LIGVTKVLPDGFVILEVNAIFSQLGLNPICDRLSVFGLTPLVNPLL